MKLSVVGSRTFSDYDYAEQVITSLNEFSTIDTVVSGGARGADAIGEQFANEFGLQKLIFPADWAKYGRRAGIIRNADIIKNCDVCVAFWDGESHGTKNDLDLCRQYGKKCYVVYFKEKRIEII